MLSVLYLYIDLKESRYLLLVIIGILLVGIFFVIVVLIHIFFLL